MTFRKNVLPTMKNRMPLYFVLLTAVAVASTTPSDLVSARDRQDRASLDRMIGQYRDTAAKQNSADANYKAALAYSYSAEVAMEVKDKRKAEEMAETGMDFARKAVDANQSNAEYHRLLGELCGQVIPANPIFGGMKYGQCARDEVNKAIQNLSQ